MDIVIAGCGKIGVAILDSLIAEGHNVTVIDSSANKLNEITNAYDVMGVCGNTADSDVLREAGADKTDVFISVTGSDELNMLGCLFARRLGSRHTIARIRTDYVHEQQSRHRTAIADLEQRINGTSSSERVKLSKQLATLQAQAEEIRVYEEKIHHLADQMISIEFDEGIKKNYAIFKDVLAKI